MDLVTHNLLSQFPQDCLGLAHYFRKTSLAQLIYKFHGLDGIF